jgi:arabinose-5-phosphate isomerase
MSVTPTVDVQLARRVLETEAAAILGVRDRLNAAFPQAVHLLLSCRGRVVVTGVGKSGIIGQKIAATLSSTGTPAFFLHPGDAVHGDLGALTGEDVVIALSYSGATEELLRILHTVKALGARLIALTGDPTSALATGADVTLDCAVPAEACPLGLAPTASTTATLALGDALAMSVLEARGFRVEDFARLHPGGRIGRQLMRVGLIMHTGDQIPAVSPSTAMPEVIYEMSRKGLGMTCVVDAERHLLGLITDGDLRRHMGTTPAMLTLTAQDLMTRQPRTVSADLLAIEALRVMEDGPRKITSVVVVDAAGVVEGVVHIHDLLRTDLG